MSAGLDEFRRALLAPRSVALIGASDNQKRLTARPQRFLSKHGFDGAVYPVNPMRESVLGVPAFKSIADVPGPVDHATILLNADPALNALEQCAASGVKVVTVLADGFAEAGPEGLARQAKLEEIAQSSDMLVIGPNSMGVVTPGAGFACTTNAAFALDELPGGKFSVLSQSGSMIGAMASRGAATGLGFKHYVSVGNEACIGVGELGQLLVDDPEIDGFVLFLETIRRPEQVAEFAARARAAGKPVAAYMVGRSEAGADLAVSHTGAMAGGGRAIEAFLDAHGIVLVDNFEALIEMPAAMGMRARLSKRPKTVTVVTTTGGGGGMVYDLLGLKGLALARMPPGVQAALAAQGIELRDGPIVDVTLAGAQYDVMKAVISALITHPESGLIVPAIGSSALFDPELAVRPIVDAVAEAGPDAAPVVAVPLPHAPSSLRLFSEGGVPAFSSVASCAAAVACLIRDPVNLDLVSDQLSEEASCLLDKPTTQTQLNELEASQVFATVGVPIAETLLVDGDLPDPLPFDGPYVVKALSSQLAHKSEHGAVRFDRETANDIKNDIIEIASIFADDPDVHLDGFLLQRMEVGLGEAIVGLTRDPVVGPMISVGAGGVLAEIYKDVVLHPAPVSVATARDMVDQVKGFAPLRGYRNAPAGDLEALALIVAQVSLLARSERVEEAEINPVLVKADGAVALDALIRLKDAS